ncbi:DUF6894 family protein [Methylobacterium sp. CM6257]|jgi:hypothetical protein
MLRRFYFDFEDGQETIRDDEGVEAEDLEQALADARSVIREMAGEVAANDPGEAWALVVRDETGSSVARLPIEKSQHRFSSSDRGRALKLIQRPH